MMHFMSLQRALLLLPAVITTAFVVVDGQAVGVSIFVDVCVAQVQTCD